jgi:hypothetical protein
MSDDKEVSDSAWLRLQRLESDRRAWLWTRLKSVAGWTVVWFFSKMDSRIASLEAGAITQKERDDCSGQ